jgi:D-glycero-D-manno-heptose 1,7-bisphosphate phosphatase
MVKNKAIFLDRDGVINRAIIVNKKAYSPRRIKNFKIYKDIRNLNKFKKNYYLIVITNQPDLKNKKIDLKILKRFHNLINTNVKIDKYYVCPHTDNEKCKCRKPKIGLFLKAKKKFNLDLKKSIFIGDRWKDMIAGNKARCKNIFIDRNYSETKSKKFKYIFKVRTTAEAIKKIKYLQSLHHHVQKKI